MEVFIVILLVWAVLTVLGHGSWVAVRAVGRFLSGSNHPARKNEVNANASAKVSAQRPNPANDLAAFERMINALQATDKISSETARKLKDRARAIVRVEKAKIARPPSRDRVEAAPLASNEVAVGDQSVRLHDSPKVDERAPEIAPKREPIPRDLNPVRSAAPRTPATPQRALSEVIASFLAAHNIRWGELIAGLLIVVCSIGLVVSLWNTLTSTHRVVPSLIFMSGDAAIFAAGLYTMRRWKLRHTSRAVLIIATLLVPLCVLAGLAAAGASVDSVSLFSPSTLAAIVIGTLGCGWLLWQASLALVGRGGAASLTASVVAPTLCLPLLPTAARLLGVNAGCFLIVPAAVSAIALLYPARRYCRRGSTKKPTAMRVGSRFWKNHWLRIGLAVASFTSLVVYAAFLFKADGRAAWIQIAIATVPVLVAIGAVHASYLKLIWKQPKWATPRFIATVLVIMSIGCVLAILPASIERVDWLWMHAAAVSISLVLAVFLLEGKPRLLAASVPLGIAAMLSSPAWLAGVDWGDVPVWRTLLGGEPLMVAVGLTCLSGVAYALGMVSTKGVEVAKAARSVGSADVVLAFWAAVGTIQAVALSFAPPSWLGMLPAATLAGILAILMVAAAVLAMRHAQIVWLSAVTGASFWMTCLGVVRWSDEGFSVASLAIAPAMMGWSVSMLVLAIVLKVVWSERRPASWTSACPTIARLTEFSAASACGVVAAQAILAAMGGRESSILVPTWESATWLIAAAGFVLAAASIVVNNRRYLQLAMLVSVSAVFCGVTGQVGVELWQQPSWESGHALWSLAYVFVVVAVGWFGLREAVRAWQPKLSELFASRLRMPDGWLALAAAGILVVAVTWRYLAVLLGPLDASLIAESGIAWESRQTSVFHFAMLAATGFCVWLWQVREPSRWLRRVLGVLGAIGGLLLSIVISSRLADSPSMRLVITTTLACAGILAAWCVAIWIGRMRKHSPARLLLDRSVGLSAIALLVSLGSAVLIWSNWWLPISEGLAPDRWSTLAVASWWLAASLGLLLGGGTLMERQSSERAGQGGLGPWLGWSDVVSTGRHDADGASILSAMLLPMAVGISMPVMFATPPVVWWQASAWGSVGWLLLAWGSPQGEDENGGVNESNAGASLSWVWIVGVGLLSAAFVLWRVFQSAPANWLVDWTLPLGAITSLLALLVYCRDRWTSPNLLGVSGSKALSNLPFLPVVMSGHIAVVAETMGWVTATQTQLVVMGCALIGCIGSAIVVWQKSPALHAWHVVFQTVVLTGFALLDGWNASRFTGQLAGSPEWMALGGLAIGAIALMRFAPPREPDASLAQLQSVDILPRLFGWFVVIAGGWILIFHPAISWLSDLVANTFLMGWTGACVVLWRSDRLMARGNQQPARADIGVSWLLLPMLAFSLNDLMNLGGFPPGHSLAPTAMCLVQGMIAIAVAVSAWLRPAVVPTKPVSMWTVSMALIASGAAVAAAGLSPLFGYSKELIAVSAMMSAAVSTSVLVGALPWAERLRMRLARGVQNSFDASPSVDRLSIAIERVILGLAWIGTFVSIGLFNNGSDANWGRTSVLAMGVLAWSMFQLSEQTMPVDSAAAERRRWRCITLGLWMVALIAVLGEPSGQAWVLKAVMRLLISGVLAIGMLMFAVPRLLRGSFLDRWQLALRRGGRLAAYVTAGALLCMIGLEMLLRDSGIGIPGIGKPLVVVVACLLGALALMAGVIAILSGPGFNNSLTAEGERANWLRMDDSRRQKLLYAAQAIAGLAWLHVFLCRTGLAFLGLRQVWPYIVMVLAFASVGLTQWAIRRGDRVLSETMRKNAMFLPLIPVIGFWLSGAYATMFESHSWSWTFYRGTTSYQGLLIVGAIYYGVLSVMWKQGLPRIATVVLANGALWVMLTQVPGWDFLAHPQAWLISPAVCVLAVAYWQRDELDSTLGSAIRYGATLVIYISSTADMLMNDIGSSLWGPVILVLLSLAGMLVGVALRVKPFLYLGTIFIFLGVMSMVWHAGQALDAVWPWWVFGITTGLILLSVLAGIEKQRDKLQRWSEELAKWES